MRTLTTALRSLQGFWASTPRDGKPSSLQAAHVQVCPPDPFPSSGGLSTLAREWLVRGKSGQRQSRDALDRFFAVREEFMRAVVDVKGGRTLLMRVERARSMRELWHLRAAVFHVVAVEFSQYEADKRLAGLNRHFPTRSARSGVVPLAS